MAKRELTARYLFFIAGLFVNAFGISLIIKANLGSSPISSLPYTLSLKFPVTLGQFTLLLNAVLIAGQIWLLKKDFRKEQFLQSRTILFSFFIDCLDGFAGRIHSCGLCLADSITDSWLCDTWPGSKYGGNCQCSDAIR